MLAHLIRLITRNFMSRDVIPYQPIKACTPVQIRERVEGKRVLQIRSASLKKIARLIQSFILHRATDPYLQIVEEDYFDFDHVNIGKEIPVVNGLTQKITAVRIITDKIVLWDQGVWPQQNPG